MRYLIIPFLTITFAWLYREGYRIIVLEEETFCFKVFDKLYKKIDKIINKLKAP